MPYIYNVGQVVNDTLKIAKQTRVKRGNKTEKGYIVKSLAYPDDKNDYEIPETYLKRGVGCAYVAGRRVCNENSLWSIKSIRPHIIDVGESKTVTPSSHKKLKFKCSTDGCNTTKMMAPNTLIRQSFSCPNCSTGIKYPERFTSAYLTVKNISHETQVRYDDLKDRRYDFRIKLNGVTFLCETHGEQHFSKESNSSAWKNAHKKTIESDGIKRQYAKDNNINLIELDCRESSFEWIRKQIERNEHLPNINDDEVDAMLEIMELNSKYPVKEIVDAYLIARKTIKKIAKHYNVDATTVKNILRRQNVELRNDRNAKLVKCIETGIVYESTMDIQRKLGINNTSISYCCSGKQKTAAGYTFSYLSDIESNAHHRAQYRHDNSETDTIELDGSIDLLAMLNYKNNT